MARIGVSMNADLVRAVVLGAFIARRTNGTLPVSTTGGACVRSVISLGPSVKYKQSSESLCVICAELISTA